MTSELSRRNFLKTAGAASTLLAAHHEAVGTEAADAPGAGGRKKDVIIDSHVHLKHGDATRSEWPAQVIVSIMDKAGIDKSVVFAICTTTKRSIEMAELAATSYPDRLIPYAYALPSYERPVLKELEAALKDKLFKGIKVHAGECTLPEYIIDPVLKLAGRFEVPCLIDVVGNHAQARRMAKAFPDTTIIYAHMGRYLSQDAKLVDSFIKLAEDYKNVLLDLSGVELVAKIGEAVRRVGPGKLVWGTDGPYAHPELVLYAKNELDKVRKLDIRPEEKGKILGGNIARLLKLKA
jgi:predicted TIM-barrel fold metal-dependent hydrolase